MTHLDEIPATAASVIAVSPAEAARLIGLGRTRLYEEISSGALRTFRLGRRRMISIAAIKEWVAKQEAALAGGNNDNPR